MLRPACLPSPPDWLRRRDGTRLSLRLLRTFVIPAFDARCRQPALGIRLDGRTGNLPSSELSPDKSPRLVRLHSLRMDSGYFLCRGHLSWSYLLRYRPHFSPPLVVSPDRRRGFAGGQQMGPHQGHGLFLFRLHPRRAAAVVQRPRRVRFYCAASSMPCSASRRTSDDRNLQY